MSDPEAALAEALRAVGDPCGVGSRTVYTDEAPLILAALPADAALFTVDSLAAAFDRFDGQTIRYGDKALPAAIIQAAKEAERE